MDWRERVVSDPLVRRRAVQNKPHVLAVPPRTLPLLPREPRVGQLWTITEAGVRIRSAP